MNFLLSNKMSAQAAYQQISSIADAHRYAQHAGPKWLFTSYFNESLEGFVFPESVRNVCFVNYQHSLDNVVFTQNIKTLKLIGYNLTLNGNFQNIDLLVLDNCQTTVPANIKNITICKKQLNNQIIADVQKYTFYDCQVINTTFKNTKNIHFNNCTVKNISFSSDIDTVCTDTDNLKQFHFSGPCNLHIYCPFEVIEFEHDMAITTYQIIDHPKYKLVQTTNIGHECYVYEYRPFKLVFVD